MFESLETGPGLDLILSLQAGRNEFLEILVILLDFMGDELFFIALTALIYWTMSKRIGVRAYFALVVISIAVFVLKDLFGRPRPFVVSELVQPVFETEGFGIPSGHTAIALMLWGYLAYAVRKTWFTALVVFYVLLQGVGRMIAGVHYPQDIVAGLLLGGVTLALYIPLADRVAVIWQQRAAWQQVLIALVFAAIGLLFFSQSEDTLTIIALLAGGCLGITLQQFIAQFSPHPAAARRAIQYLIGLALSIGILFGLDVLFGDAEPAALLRIVRYALVAIFALALWPWLSIQAGLMTQAESKSVTQAA